MKTTLGIACAVAIAGCSGSGGEPSRQQEG